MQPGGVHFRVWAPQRSRVAVLLQSAAGKDTTETVELAAEGDGYFSGTAPGAEAGSLYWFQLDADPTRYPDPASRFQPDGPHGPSQAVDPRSFEWTDQDWRGVQLKGQVLYEMHIGTFTAEGTWQAAMRELPELARAGITVLELMPVAEFPGRFGWGYDGVDLFAPTRLYGTPDKMRQFVNEAHRHGLGVILDVVYNHLGPDGNYLKAFAEDYFSKVYTTDWGEAINYDGPNNGPVREFFETNAAYWIDEFHLDGLRIDATQDVHDKSAEHILAAITRRVRQAAQGRGTIVIAENEPQCTQLVRPPERDGYGMDALWNDDFHHTAMVRLSGRSEAYYNDYLGNPQEFISAMKWGYLYQGQWYRWQKKRRGHSTRGVPPAAFVLFIQNHDQIANSGKGLRAHRVASPGCYKAMTALMLLGPGTPMLFQGQEFAASSPFFYFADHREDLAKMVEEGRRKFLAQFPSIAQPEVQANLPDPADPQTFVRSKLDFADRQRNAEIYNLHTDLLTLRREDEAFSAQRPGGLDGAVLGDDAFVLRYFVEDNGDRLLLVNFGTDVHLDPAPEPLLAPPEGKRWTTLWSTEEPKYGGVGIPPVDTKDDNWHIPGQAAVVLAPIDEREESSDE